MNYKVIDGGIAILEDAFEKIREIDAIIFDCDGTLIDVTSSFQLAGKIITMIYLEQFYGIECRIGDDYDEAFQLLKMLGGFNNTRRVISVLLQAVLVHAEDARLRKTGLDKIDLESYLDRVGRGVSEPASVAEALEWIISKLENLLGNYVTMGDVELMIEEKAKRIDKLNDLLSLRNLIGPLFLYGSGIFATIFSEIWLGGEGIRAKYSVKPRFYDGPGLIEYERLLVREGTLKELKALAPKGLAILSGRGVWEASKSLGDLLKYFDVDASVFLADRSAKLEKPNPEGLITCCSKLGAERVIYVGDGGEDLFLVREASKKGLHASLAGLLTNKYAYTFFTKLGAEIILENVNLLPKLFKRL